MAHNTPEPNELWRNLDLDASTLGVLVHRLGGYAVAIKPILNVTRDGAIEPATHVAEAMVRMAARADGSQLPLACLYSAVALAEVFEDESFSGGLAQPGSGLALVKASLTGVEVSKLSPELHEGPQTERLRRTRSMIDFMTDAAMWAQKGVVLPLPDFIPLNTGVDTHLDPATLEVMNQPLGVQNHAFASNRTRS